MNYGGVPKKLLHGFVEKLRRQDSLGWGSALTTQQPKTPMGVQTEKHTAVERDTGVDRTPQRPRAVAESVHLGPGWVDSGVLTSGHWHGREGAGQPGFG